jgi:hypothetical protein
MVYHRGSHSRVERNRPELADLEDQHDRDSIVASVRIGAGHRELAYLETMKCRAG